MISHHADDCIVKGDRKLGLGHGHVVEVDFLTLRDDVQITHPEGQ